MKNKYNHFEDLVEGLACDLACSTMRLAWKPEQGVNQFHWGIQYHCQWRLREVLRAARLDDKWEGTKRFPRLAAAVRRGIAAGIKVRKEAK